MGNKLINFAQMLCLLFCVVAYSPTHAVNWLQMSGFKGRSFDIDSMERGSGYIRVWVRIDRYDVLYLLDIDCKSKLYSIVQGNNFGPPANVAPGSFEEALMKYYCKYSWQFWK